VPHLPHSTWREAYQEALLEKADTDQLTRVKQAEAAIYSRLQEIAGNPDHHEERQSLNKATSVLRNLQTTRLNFPE
jgi:hypothetical protein